MFIHEKVLINDNAKVRDTVGRNDQSVAHSDLCDVDFSSAGSTEIYIFEYRLRNNDISGHASG